MPSPAQRLVASTANRTLAVLDCPYAAHGSYGRSRKWMSSNTTGERRCALELTDTTRALPAAARAPCSRVARAKWPRWLVANCISQPSGVRIRGEAMIPALLMSMSSGPSQAAANAATEAWSARSSRATRTCLLPVVPVMSSAVRSPASTLRTARVTSAPAPASARAVSMPIPDAPPVTMARRPVRSMPSTTSAAVDSAVNGVVIGVLAVMMPQSCSAVRCGTFWWPRSPADQADPARIPRIRPGSFWETCQYHGNGGASSTHPD